MKGSELQAPFIITHPGPSMDSPRYFLARCDEVVNLTSDEKWKVSEKPFRKLLVKESETRMCAVKSLLAAKQTVPISAILDEHDSDGLEPGTEILLKNIYI